eukprot:TRINITY_DN33986_c0_g1_i3.p1 TRINITY_DN33986_c0_g1~~TRINITY_DN33986_c0_g1_i3.p1  ORF type:complete len:444 (+),score=82.80 TRINITY_DN33986_c0_g1_i3:169-1500(+)
MKRLPLAPTESASLAGDTPGSGAALRQVSIALLVFICLACVHAIIYHLHHVIVPFVLSGFIVLAMQPSVDILYRMLTGLGGQRRWCCCCCRRVHKERRGSPVFGGESPRGGSDEEAASESDPLVASREEDGLFIQFMEGLCRCLAVTVVFLAMMLVVLIIILGVCHGALHVKDNWHYYRYGLDRLERVSRGAVDDAAKELRVHDPSLEEDADTLQHIALKKFQGYIWDVVNYIVVAFSDGFSSLAIMLLYVLFWLYQPLPTGGQAGAIVRSYLYKKSLVSALFGVCVALLFAMLGIDLAILFGMIAFFLNYVPEIGAFISILVPIPVILLDGRIQEPFVVLCLAILGQLTLKFLFSNILEVKLIEADESMSIHPVWVLLGLSYFGFVWGPVGMLISVPIMAMLKTAAMSAVVVFPEDDMLPRAALVFRSCLEAAASSQGRVAH